MRLLEGLCAQTQGLIHATGEYMDHCFLPQSHALPARELEVMEAYEAYRPCNMETLFWGRTDPITGNLEPKMAVVVLAPWTFRSGHLVEFQHGGPVRPRPTRVVPILTNFAKGREGGPVYGSRERDFLRAMGKGAPCDHIPFGCILTAFSAPAHVRAAGHPLLGSHQL
jgi:hypothetical protein